MNTHFETILTPPQSLDRFTFDLQRFDAPDLSSLQNAGDTYLIQTKEDLKTLADYVNAGNDCAGLTFKQTKDITFDTVEDGQSNFTAIGYYVYDEDTKTEIDCPFKGTYDGCNFKISDLKITSTDYCQGLFGNVGSSCTIQKVHLVNANISGTSWVGGLVGYNEGAVEDCTVTGVTVSGENAVGSFVGYNEGTVNNCTTTGGTVSGNVYVGGLVGYNEGTVENCTTTGGSVTGEFNVAGIAGYNSNEGTIENCTTTGNTVSGTGTCVGGLVGWNYGGAVSGITEDSEVSGSWYVGGLVGSNDGGTIENCTTTGGSVSGEKYVAGIVGYNDNTISGCLVDDVNVSGNAYFGSFVGYNDGTVSGYYHNINFTGDGDATEVYLLTLPDGVTASGVGVVSFADKYYAEAGASITLSDNTLSLQDAIGNAIENNSYTMPAQDSVLYLSTETLPATISATVNNKTVALKYYVDAQGIPCYAISSAKDLKILSAYVKNGGDTTGLTFKQTKDITFTEADSNFTPIGNDSNKFKGTYDGCNFKISYLKITSTDYCQGLFGFVDGGGTVKDVHLVNANISGEHYVGGLVGWNEGTVENCTTTGGKVGGDDDVGGVVGENKGTVENCTTTGTEIISDGEGGGIVGYNNGGTVEGCLVDVSSVSGKYYAGGIVGKNEGTVDNCTTTGTEIISADAAGGIVGWNYSTVEGCLVDVSSVSGKYYAGGIVGGNEYGAVEDCTVTGGKVSGDKDVGGLVGFNEGTVKNSLLDGGTVSGNKAIGNDNGNGGYYHGSTAITGATKVFLITLPDGVTASGTDGKLHTFGGKYYAEANATVTLTITDPTIPEVTNARYALVSETYTVTKDEEITPTIYISVDGGEYSNEVAEISVIGGTGSETLINTAANVTLDGGKGNDSLVGSDKAEVFVYSGGEDTIKNFTATEDEDTIRLADGFSVSGIPQAVSNDLEINFGGSDKLIIEGAASLNSIDLYNADGLKPQKMPVENIDFNNANPATAKSAIIKSAYGDLGKQNDDGTEQYAKICSISAEQDNSTIIGNAMNNTIIIKGGSDNILTGGLGKDTYSFSAGGGIITDFGIGVTKSSDGTKLATSTTANNYDRTNNTSYEEGIDVLRVSGKVSGIYFEREGDTTQKSTFTAIITYNGSEGEQIVVLKDVVKQATKTGSSPTYQTNDVAASSLKIWDTTNAMRPVLTAVTLKKLFHDDDELLKDQEKKEQVEHLINLTELVKPKAEIITPEETPSSQLLMSTQIAFNSNSSRS